tara:strand:+ start:5352 stop:5492 length:141 start_codon:yes stop_codon:yes gene_type:complete
MGDFKGRIKKGNGKPKKGPHKPQGKKKLQPKGKRYKPKKGAKWVLL